MSDILNKHLNKLLERSKTDAKSDEVRFSLTMSEFNNRRIEYLRRTLKLSKQEFLHDIIIAAISDLEVKLNLCVYSEKDNINAFAASYLDILQSDKPIEKHFREKGKA